MCNRLTNSWRLATCSVTLPALKYENFDCVTFDHPIFSSNPIRSDVTNLTFNLTQWSVNLNLIIASEAGRNTGGSSRQ